MSVTRATLSQPGPVSALLRWQLKLAHRLLEDTINRLARASAVEPPPAMLRPDSPDTLIPAAACYAQIVYCEDVTVTVRAGWRTAARPHNLGRRVALDASRRSVDPSSGRSPISPTGRTGAAGCRLTWPRSERTPVPGYLHRYLPGHPARSPARPRPPRASPGRLLNALLLTISMRRGEIATLLAARCQPATHTQTIRPSAAADRRHPPSSRRSPSTHRRRRSPSGARSPGRPSHLTVEREAPTRFGLAGPVSTAANPGRAAAHAAACHQHEKEIDREAHHGSLQGQE